MLTKRETVSKADLFSINTMNLFSNSDHTLQPLSQKCTSTRCPLSSGLDLGTLYRRLLDPPPIRATSHSSCTLSSSSSSFTSTSSTISFIFDYLHEEQLGDINSTAAREQSEDFEAIDAENLESGVVVEDKNATAWVWRRCYCVHILCEGQVWRLVEGKTELDGWDRGRM